MINKFTKSVLPVIFIALFSGCGQEVQTPLKPQIDSTLPKVDSKSLKYIPDYKAIALEWKKVSSPNIKGYYIYRSNMQLDGQKFKRVATIQNKYTTHYLDKGLKENSKYSYAVSAVALNNNESNPTKPRTVQTLPRFESVAFSQAISNLPRQIKILWRPHTNERVSKYIIQKNDPTTPKWETLKEISDRLKVEYIDKELGDNETYKYRIVAVTFDNIISKPSKIVTATTKPLPGQVATLSATKNLPRKIILSWKPGKTQDIVSYNIYASPTVDGTYTKIFQAPVGHNMYENIIPKDGKIYFYKITTVDEDGLESSLVGAQPVMGSTLSKPNTPKITLAQQHGEKIIINWEATDNRAVSYNIYKKQKNGWSDSKVELIPNIKGLRFEDPNVIRGIEYKYAVQAVDKHGLASKKTEFLSIMLPKLFDGNKKK